MINETAAVIAANSETIVANGAINMQIISAVASMLSTLLLVGVLFGPRIMQFIGAIKIKSKIKKLCQANGRNVVVMSHVQSGIFGDMITIEDYMKLGKILRGFKGKDFDFILNTPGGDLFASLKIANMLKDYPGRVRAVIPKYAMSGGTLISLGADEIVMDRGASLGPIDPQVGGFFKSFSARAWDEILKVKGKKSNDDTIGMARLGKQATQIVEEAAEKLIDMKDEKKKKALIKNLVSGEVAHSYQFGFDWMRNTGLNVSEMHQPEYHEILETMKHSGVVAYGGKNGK